MPEPRTAAATAAVRRRGQETKAAALRHAGWLALPPEVVDALPVKLLERIRAVEERVERQWRETR